MKVGTTIRAARTALANRRTERLAHRRLAAELAFQTRAQRTELDEVLGRYSDEETRDIRAILDRQDAERLHQAALFTGHRI